jgi:hypothetical protein
MSGNSIVMLRGLRKWAAYALIMLRGLRKWAAYALILLAPGSLVVLATLWLVARLVQRRREADARAAAPSRAAPRCAVAEPACEGVLRQECLRVTSDPWACCKGMAKG